MIACDIIHGGKKYIAATGKVDTSVVKAPESINWDFGLLYVSVVRLNDKGDVDPGFSAVVFKTNRESLNWSFDTSKQYDKKTTGVTDFAGFDNGI